MASEELRNRAFQAVMHGLVETGRAPHYTELASVLGVTPEEAREAQHEAAENSPACWFVPETDYVACWDPFSNIPNNHRISVGGEQKWFALCGPAALFAPRMFPGQEVTVDTRCPQSGTEIHLRLRDGEILAQTPPGAVVLINHDSARIDTAGRPGDVSAANA